MGTYSDYLGSFAGKSFQDISDERKKQLAKISEARNHRNILVYASDVQKGKAPISIDYSDILPIKDQLANLDGDKIDVILETPGGYAEYAEDIVKLLRDKFSEVAFIIPGMAKSAGTIIVMSGDEILMEPASALGPIDAQIFNQGKVFSADAFLEGLDKIKKEVEDTGTLNKTYIPILQGISPGEIQSCINALGFSQTLVSKWLDEYKFRNWTKHSKSGAPVTVEERRSRAAEVAKKLCEHSFWLTHGRSIKIKDLEAMRLIINDYSKDHNLYDAITRYYTLLRMSFETTNIYKIFETPLSQIYRFQNLSSPLIQQKQIAVHTTLIDFQCGKCQNIIKIQANLDKEQPLQDGAISFPKDNLIKCPRCGTENNLVVIRNEIEAQTKKKVV